MNYILPFFANKYILSDFSIKQKIIVSTIKTSLVTIIYFIIIIFWLSIVPFLLLKLIVNY